MIGSILLSLSFSAALISMISYMVTMKGESRELTNIARVGFHVAVLAFMVTCAVQMYNILGHQFQYTYIWSHSSRSLSTPLLVASFYAGQEGSFMLWTLMVALIGVFVLGYAQRFRYEAPVMSFYMLVVTALLLILVVKSPFETIYASFPEQNLPANFIPTDGKGLNPSLENLWITIHPPMLFMGFAAMTVPFVMALAGLVKKDYQRWISISLPWALFASGILGFGIMLGGWWAYETLGWGGFWAWDPVENSSLIPWLVCVALVHSMLVQKRTGSNGSPGVAPRVGGLVKTNFALAIAAFGLILYSTFLTRSGVLGDTSVHSFVAPGRFVYAVLLGLIILFVGLGIGMLIWRWADLRQKALEMKLMSRENALAIGSSVILASATVVLIGTSWPIFMPLFDKPKVAVPVDFYNNLHLPIALLIVLLNGISMTLRWKDTPREEFYKKIALAFGISVIGTVGLVLLGIHDPIYIGLGFGAMLAMVVNIQIGLKILRGNPKMVGAYVSHTGVSMLMLGIIFTARYSVTEHIRLREGEATKVFDYTMTYKGAERVELEKPDRESYRYNLELERDGNVQQVGPSAFWSDFDNRRAPNMEPGILYSVTRDVYIAPKAIEQEGGDPTAHMHKGDKVPIPFDSSVVVRFDRFDMSRAASEGLQGSVIEVSSGDSTYYLTAYTAMDRSRNFPVQVPGTDISIGMVGLVNNAENQSNSETILAFRSPSHPPGPIKSVVTLDVSIKPFISLVWVGVIVMAGGFFFSIFRRRREIETQLPLDDLYRDDRPVNGNGSGTWKGVVTPSGAVEENTVARTSGRPGSQAA